MSLKLSFFNHLFFFPSFISLSLFPLTFFLITLHLVFSFSWFMASSSNTAALDVEALNGMVAEYEDFSMVETDGVERMVLPAEMVATRHWDLRWAIVGRFLPDNNLNKEAMRHTIANVWRPGRGMYVEDLEEGRFLFQFAHEEDVRRVMEGGPWNFDNHLLIFQRVKTREDPMKVDLKHIFLWMQVHNLPMGYRSERVARSVGKYVGGFLESDSNNFSGM